jgi:hypothetical protein
LNEQVHLGKRKEKTHIKEEEMGILTGMDDWGGDGFLRRHFENGGCL